LRHFGKKDMEEVSGNCHTAGGVVFGTWIQRKERSAKLMYRRRGREI